jgi:predicted permease
VARGGEGVERLTTAFVSPGFFRLMAAPAHLGRTFSADEEAADGLPVVVIAFDLWRRRYGGIPEVLGQNITIGERSYAIIGVMPQSFEYPSWAQVWTPLSPVVASTSALAQRGLNSDSRLIARLSDNVALEHAKAGVSAFGRRLAETYPAENGAWPSADLVPLRTEIMGSADSTLKIFAGAVLSVLLIVCANLATLLLVRGTGRAREMAVRTALGAGRGQLIRQLLAESVVLATLGALLGMWLARFSIDLLKRQPSVALPRLAEVTLDGWALGFTVILSGIAVVLAGLVPALKTSKLGIATDLRGAGGAGARSRKRTLVESGLVIAQCSLAMVLTVSAGLLLRSMLLVQRENAGFSAQGVLTFHIWPPSPRYDDPAAVARLYGELIESARKVPSVTAAGIVNHVPASGGSMITAIQIPGREVPGDSQEVALIKSVSEDYLTVLDIPLTAGRFFSLSDMRNPEPVAVVNEEFLRLYSPTRDLLESSITIHRAVQIRPDFGETVEVRIVGVVGNVRQFGLENPPFPEIYVPFTQAPWHHAELVVRASGDLDVVSAGLSRRIAAVDPYIPLTGGTRDAGVRRLTDLVSDNFAPRRLNTGLIAGFAGIALLLAALGLYGTMSFLVALRRREMGIRLALGAAPDRLFWSVVKEGVRLAAIGIGLGVLTALAATKLLTSLLYNVGRNDLRTFVAVIATLLVTALVASAIPGRRAMRSDPMVALRAD